MDDDSNNTTRGVLSFPWADLSLARSLYVGFHVYATTKLANIWFTRELARRLRGQLSIAARDTGGSPDPLLCRDQGPGLLTPPRGRQH